MIIGVPFSAVYMAASTPFAVPPGRRAGAACIMKKAPPEGDACSTWKRV
ncbi:hypothetical protein HMPREF1545_04050 [Oscillibacter sp. KLE 1728]|nr:hypothetical protein HMPREF1545_04050 [Oscillibacter sp. KLE 1728]